MLVQKLDTEKFSKTIPEHTIASFLANRKISKITLEFQFFWLKHIVLAIAAFIRAALEKNIAVWYPHANLIEMTLLQ